MGDFGELLSQIELRSNPKHPYDAGQRNGKLAFRALGFVGGAGLAGLAARAPKLFKLLKGRRKPITNPVPQRLARVVDTKFESTPTLGSPNSLEAFVTAADDIKGITNSTDLAKRLTLVDNAGNLRTGPFSIIEFDTPVAGIASPVFRDNPGFIHGGLTAGGAREFVLPNLRITSLSGVTTRRLP